MISKFSVYHLIFAALMHDIGKVIQRTREADEWETEKHLDKCVFPKGRNYPTYKHVMYTARFLDKYSLPLKDWETVIEIAGCHHNKNVYQHTEYSNYLDYLIEADRTSSSWDREQGEENLTDRERYRKVPLYSIFDQISFDTEISGHKKVYKNVYLLGKKVPGESIFPQRKEKNTGEVLSDEYSILWSGFLKDFEQVYFYYYKL